MQDGPLTGFSATGLAAAGSVYADTPATVRGVWGLHANTLGLTVRNIEPDSFGSYAGDGLDDDWQVLHFGLDSTNAAPGLQCVQIDLLAPHALYALAVWHYHAQARAYHDVIVLVSNDPEFATGVTAVFNNDHDNSSGLGQGSDLAYVESHQGLVIPAGGIVGRYIRLYSNGSTASPANHYIEVEAYGLPTK